MDIRELIERLMGRTTDVPKNVPGRGDFVGAIIQGMKPKPKQPGADYPKRVKVTT